MMVLEADHSPQCSAEVKHKWCSAFTPFGPLQPFTSLSTEVTLFLVCVLRMLLAFLLACVVFCNSLFGCLGVIYHKPIVLGFMELFGILFLFFSGKWNAIEHQNILFR